MIYVRARWYDPSTASFLTPDPMGYRDSSNLYAYAKNDPVNFSDPSGEAVNVLVGGLVSAGVGCGISLVFGQKCTWEDAAVDFALGAATSGLSTFSKFGKAARYGMRAGGEIAIDVGAEIVRHKLKHEDWELKDLAAGAVRNFAIGETGALVGRKVLKGARGLNEKLAKSKAGVKLGNAMEPLPYGKQMRDELLPSPCRCFGEGTEVATPDGLRPIESLRVGERVTTTDAEGTKPDGWTSVTNPDEWRLVKLRMPNPDASGDVLEIELLRPVEWVEASGAAAQSWISITLPEMGLQGPAEVVSIGPAPEIKPGPGRLILATFTHVDELLELWFEGLDEPVFATPWHQFYSGDRMSWVPAQLLTLGESIHAAGEKQSLLANTSGVPPARVFEIEIELDHSYAVSSEGLLSHNTKTCDFRFARQWHDKRADEIFGKGKGTEGLRIFGDVSFGKKGRLYRAYDKTFLGFDIEFKSDNFRGGTPTRERLKSITTQLEKDIELRDRGIANPWWHFNHDPSNVPAMKDFMELMNRNRIPWTFGPTAPTGRMKTWHS